MRLLPLGLFIILGGLAGTASAEGADAPPSTAEKELREEYTGGALAPDEEAIDVRSRDFFMLFYWDRGLLYELHQTLRKAEGETEFSRRVEKGLGLKGRAGIQFALDAAAYAERGDLPEIDDVYTARRDAGRETGGQIR